MECYNLFLTGSQDIDANDIDTDNTIMRSNLNVSDTTYLYISLNVQGVNILKYINYSNNIINKSSSIVQINASNMIFFNVNNT